MSEPWSGPLSDAHTHDDLPPWETEAWATALLLEMNASGVQRVGVVGGMSEPARAGETPLQARRARDEGWVGLASRCDRLLVHLSGVDAEDAQAGDYVRAMRARAPFVGVGALELGAEGLPPGSTAMASVVDALAPGGVLQFHDFESPAASVAVRAVAKANPDVHFIGFGCAHQAADPSNLSCAIAWTDTDGTRPPTRAHATDILGADVGPAAFEDDPRGARSTFAGAVRDTRQKLGALPADQAQQLAHGRFDAIYR